MRKTILFMMVSIDGFFEGPNHELDWHHVDAEFNDFAAGQLDEAGILLFGGKTYELMAGYWPTEHAKKDDPVIAGKMNAMAKIVASESLEKADWNNTRLIREHAFEEIDKLKRQPGKDLLMLGSNNFAVGCIGAGLLDEVRVMVNPVALGKGHTLFTGLKEKWDLKLAWTKVFKSGNVLLVYRK